MDRMVELVVQRLVDMGYGAPAPLHFSLEVANCECP